MGPWGAIIMGFFGSVFFALTARPYAAAPGTYLLPVAVFAGIAIGAWRILRQQPADATQPSARAERVIKWATIGEGVAMPVVATVLGNTGHADAVLCGIALVVGLHFIPMAYAIPFPPFYASTRSRARCSSQRWWDSYSRNRLGRRWRGWARRRRCGWRPGPRCAARAWSRPPPARRPGGGCR